MRERGVLCGLLLLSIGAWGQGAIDVYVFDDPAQEAHYKRLIEEFRCPKCLNTNLAGSDAPIAADLRRTVHELVVAGRTDAEIRDHLQARYGDFVLYDPPLRTDTVMLWLLPALLLIVAVVAIGRLARRHAAPASGSLDSDERDRLQQLLGDADGSEPHRE